MSVRRPGNGRVLPPVVFFAALILMPCMHLLFPVRLIDFPARFIGLPPVVFGIAIVLWAAGLFRGAGTTIKPFEASTTLVLHGPYRLTRNPMYVGTASVLVGVGLLLGSASPFVVVAAFVIVLDLRFIRAEEAALENTFGAEYRDYKKRVRRWV